MSIYNQITDFKCKTPCKTDVLQGVLHFYSTKATTTSHPRNSKTDTLFQARGRTFFANHRP